DSSVRGQGHGQTLVRHAQQWFQDRGFKHRLCFFEGLVKEGSHHQSL
ncbi:GNAT family N-acetyltransferase, partial [Pseudomonas protegens]